ncbi:MAG: hypothetical protein JSW31_17670 [Burkholderiales bacterium]|jgi:hypothetical protein|nr:MAG: hypothetical protein JSW31_17670 [Burkholderiales bacterium]
MFPSNLALRCARGVLLLAGAGTGLSACYVIPMNPDGSPAWQYLPPGAVAPVVAPAPVVAIPSVPAGPPVPSSYQARLYPMNSQAAQSGQLTATITDLHTGRGVLAMNLSGEYLSGEATRVSDAHPGFGTVYEKVLGTPVRMQPGQPHGIANAVGSRGTWVNCEYVLERGGRGTGACLMSNGAAYQIHFGG